VLVLEQALLGEIGLDEDAEVELTVKDGGLFLAAARTEEEEDRRVHAAFERIAADRRAVLRRLAD
jgi:antitoxin component of MazEF toxin-antitoxin module